MRKKLNLGKLAVVIFLTILIWVWADLRQDEEYPLEGAKITAKANDSWVQLNGGESVTIDEITFKGPLSNINDLKRRELAGAFQATFLYDPKKEGTLISGERQIDVAAFIAAQPDVKDLGVFVESSEPQSITVNIVPLNPQSCRIECTDEYGNTLTQAKIEPPTIEMPIPDSWTGEARVAYVKLTADEAAHAQTEPVGINPFIKLAVGQTRISPESVQVTLPAQGNNMKEYLSVPAVLYIAYTQNMHEKYKAEVMNATDLSSLSIRATPEAYAAYCAQSNKSDEAVPQITLYVLDDDVNKQAPIRRNVVYNFPLEYVRKGQIEIVGKPEQAEFKLVEISPRPLQ